MEPENEKKDTSTLIYIDDKDPEEPLKPKFPTRDVLIKRNVDARRDFELLSEIGRGKFGTVYKCKEKETGLELAAKFVPIPNREDRRNVEREVEIMNSLQHHLIIQLYAAYEYQKKMCVVLELVEGGELFDRVIDEDFILTEKVCAVFMRQICEAMQFIHKNNILHLDLKPENILCLSREGNRIKIIDFGLARKFDPDKKLQILFGTPEFVAPEVVNFDCISYGTDMWSVGVICYVLLSGLSPFMGETDIETMANVTIAKYDFDDEAFNNVSADALDFIRKLLVKDINVRMTATECLEHKWLKRKPKPPIPPKPLNAPPPKFITTSPTPPREIKPVELDTTKDNLRNFIERWEEHPNSPYVFDNGTSAIAPLKDTLGDSSLSSRACSPSTCESISTTNEDIEVPLSNPIIENPKPALSEKSTNGEDLSNTFKEYLHSFDRRKSDTNCILSKKPAGETFNLVDEIRKLSDHLLMLSEINVKLEREIVEENIITADSGGPGRTERKTRSPIQNGFARSQSCVESDKEFTKHATHRSANPVIKMTTSPTIFEKKPSSVSSSGDNKTSTLSIHLKALDEDPKISTNGKTDKPVKKRPVIPKVKTKNGFRETVSFVETTRSAEKGFGVPWPVTKRRTKFRVNEMSRDVPIGSPNTHQTFNLEDAKSTKDRLLHLLEKYHDRTTATTPTNGLNNRHSSISLDWNVSEDIEHRSISSISAFFRKHAANGRNVQQLRSQLESRANHH